MKKNIFTFTVLIAVLLSVIITGCGKSEKPKKKFDTTPVSIKQFDTPPGADPSVPAEQGGNGFKGEGWETRTDINIQGNPKSVKGGSLVYSLPEFPATLRTEGKDANLNFNLMMTNLMYETLLGRDAVTSEYVPMLATHWKISDDKLTFKFRINPDARWADGKPVTSEDVIATWKLLIDPGILDPYNNMLWQTFEEPVAESKYIVSIKSKELNWRQFHYAAYAMRIYPAHFIGNISGKEYLEKYQFLYIPGSGPYVVIDKDVVKGQSIIVRRRSDYWGEKEKFNTGINNFDFIKFDFVTDETLEYEKFKKGEIDVMGIRRASIWQEKFEFEDVKRGLIVKKRVFNDYPAGIQGICINTRKAPFDDVKIRKAFAYMFDRIKFNEKLFYGAYVPMDSYFPGTEYENPSNPKIRFNLDSAKLLLSQAGWTEKNSDGYLIKDGKIFQVDLPFQKGMDRYLTIYQEDLKKVGIKMNLKEIDATTIFKLGNERNFTLLPISWSGLDIPNPEGAFKSNTADEPNTTNWTGIKDKRIDDLCDKYNITFDQKERIKIIREMDKLLCDFAGYILMWYAPYQRVVFHNKFGYPEGILGKETDVNSIPILWYNDPEKALEYDDAVKDKTKTMQAGDIDNKYWFNLRGKEPAGKK